MTEKNLSGVSYSTNFLLPYPSILCIRSCICLFRCVFHCTAIQCVVSRTSQNGQFGVSVFSIMCRWVALVYLVPRRGMITCSFLPCHFASQLMSSGFSSHFSPLSKVLDCQSLQSKRLSLPGLPPYSH
jgi:hypothetical protein